MLDDFLQSSGVRSEFIAVGEVTLHTVLAGPADGPLVILLHGFPEFWFGWRNQILPLAQAGFRVAVPDQRGYNLSQKPINLSAYDSFILAISITSQWWAWISFLSSFAISNHLGFPDSRSST
jgi:pimeloyl-ACP methyl ester carboxylesterase